MNPKYFDYIFRQSKVAHQGQPIELFTTLGEVVIGRFNRFYSSTDNENPVAELIELDLPTFGKNIFKCDDILKIKLTFQNEFINNQCDYSLMCMFDYFELLVKAEVNLKNKKVVTGYITSYPDSLGNFEAYIGFVDSEGGRYDLTLGEIENFSLLFEHQAYIDNLL